MLALNVLIITRIQRNYGKIITQKYLTLLSDVLTWFNFLTINSAQLSTSQSVKRCLTQLLSLACHYASLNIKLLSTLLYLLYFNARGVSCHVHETPHAFLYKGQFRVWKLVNTYAIWNYVAVDE